MLPFYTEDAALASVKLVATDMDLTLLHTDKSMPKGMPERIGALRENGVLFCAASGRPIPALLESFPESTDTMAFIADNGASVYVGHEAIYKDLIDNTLYHEVLAMAEADGRGVPVLCCFDSAYALERDRQHHDELSIYYKTIHYVGSFEQVNAESNKISIYCPAWDSPQQAEEMYEPAFGNRLYVTCAGREWLDFMNIGINKGSGIRKLAEHLGIGLADVAAFGDTDNDIPMLDVAGHSFIVANAADYMERHAHFRCPSNEDEGVLTVIDAILAARTAA